MIKTCAKLFHMRRICFKSCNNKLLQNQDAQQFINKKAKTARIINFNNFTTIIMLMYRIKILLEVKLPHDLVCPSVNWLDGWSVRLLVCLT